MITLFEKGDNSTFRCKISKILWNDQKMGFFFVIYLNLWQIVCF